MMIAISAGEVTPDFGDMLMILKFVSIIVFLYLLFACIEEIEACLSRFPKLLNSLLLYGRTKL